MSWRADPTADRLHAAAADAGLVAGNSEHVSGSHAITDDYIAKLADQCSSALRLISSEALNAGLARVRQAQAAGQQWQSRYTVYQYLKAQDAGTGNK